VFLVDSKVEAKVVVQALRLNTLSKLTFADLKRFDGLVRDIFPNVEFQDVDYEKLADAVRASAQELNLVVMPNQVNPPHNTNAIFGYWRYVFD
jgi:dynein heavy chain 2